MDSDEDGIKLFGTAFEKLESNEIASKKPEIDQTVRDERGRRRFHGAFTGGFSAGYWNTVGSAEGFTPQMFKSSRKNKYESASSSKPEDFMDDEDFSAYGIAPKTVQTTDDFVDNLQFAGIRGNTFDDAVRSVFSSSQESIGKRLYRKMKLSAQVEKKIKYGHDLLVSDSERRSKIEAVKYQDVDFKCKDNFHGIGYTGAIDANKFLFKAPELSGKDSANNKQNTIQTTISGGKKLKISGEAFGMGALEEDDEYGGMSIYFNDDMSQYDFELGKKEEKSQPKKKRKFKDTQNVDPNQIGLESFKKSSKSVSLFNELRRRYRLPELPKNWKPKLVAKPEVNVRKSRWDAKTSKPEIVTESRKNVIQNVSAPKSVLNAHVRSALIGEEVVYQTGVVKKPTVSPTVPPIIPTFERRPLSGILASKFVSSNPTSSSNPDDVQLSAGLSTFAQVSSQNQSFVTRPKNSDNVYVDDGSQIEAPVRIVLEWHPHRLLCKRFGLQDPFVNNSHVGVVGSYESSLKLQQLKQQVSSPSIADKSKPKSSLTEKKQFTNLFQNLNEVNDYYSEKDAPLGEEFDRFKMEKEKVPASEEKQEEPAPVVPRASIQALKSVFASDEEDLHSGEDDMEDDNEEMPDSLKESQPKKPNTGLFAGIDFSAVNAQQFNDTGSFVFQSKKRPLNDGKDNNDDDDDDDDGYGPVLPPSSSSGNPSQKSSKPEDERSTRKNKSRRKDKKEKKSKKKSKKKEKRKKEKKHRHRKSSSSSASSNEDEENDSHDKDKADLDSQILAFIRLAREPAS